MANMSRNRPTIMMFAILKMETNEMLKSGNSFKNQTYLFYMFIFWCKLVVSMSFAITLFYN